MTGVGSTLMSYMCSTLHAHRANPVDSNSCNASSNRLYSNFLGYLPTAKHNSLTSAPKHPKPKLHQMYVLINKLLI